MKLGHRRYAMAAILRAFIIAISIGALWISPASAREITGDGKGKTREEAQAAALSDLSKAIQVEVKSDFLSKTTAAGSKMYQDVEETVKVSSNLPIIGAEYVEVPSDERGVVHMRAYVNVSRVAPLYESKLKDLAAEISFAMAMNDKGGAATARYEALEQALSDAGEFSRYKAVAVMLGSKDIPALPASETDIKTALGGIEFGWMDSIESAAAFLGKSALGKAAKGRAVFVYPPKASTSHEVTQFAAAVRDRVASVVSGTRDAQSAELRLEGTYEERGQGVEVLYRLSDRSGSTIESGIMRISKAGYAGYETKPKTSSFDNLLHEGLAVSNDFRVELATNHGTESLMFRGGETMDLVVKANKPAYFYLVGHVNKEDEKMSYIIELQEAEGQRRFVYFINADDVNKWINIGSFEVAKPYGVESLQLIASTDDLVGKLPKARYDQKSGLDVISVDPSKAVSATRALKPKRTTQVMSTEAVLMYTTLERQ